MASARSVTIYTCDGCGSQAETPTGEGIPGGWAILQLVSRWRWNERDPERTTILADRASCAGEALTAWVQAHPKSWAKEGAGA